MGAPLANAMISLWPSMPEWICHWLVVPISVKEAPCAVVPKPTKRNESPVAAPLPAKSRIISLSAWPALNTNVSLPALPWRTSVPAPPSSTLSPDMPLMLLASALPVPARLPEPCSTQLLHVRFQRMGYGRENRIQTCIGILDHRIAGVVNVVDVVAGAADHGVGAGI